MHILIILFDPSVALHCWVCVNHGHREESHLAEALGHVNAFEMKDVAHIFTPQKQGGPKDHPRVPQPALRVSAQSPLRPLQIIAVLHELAKTAALAAPVHQHV